MDIPGLSQLAKQLHGRCPHRQSTSGLEHKRARKDLCQYATLTHAQHALVHAISEHFGWLLNKLFEQICDVARVHARDLLCSSLCFSIQQVAHIFTSKDTSSKPILIFSSNQAELPSSIRCRASYSSLVGVSHALIMLTSAVLLLDAGTRLLCFPGQGGQPHIGGATAPPPCPQGRCHRFHHSRLLRKEIHI